jgi:aminoglycoside phosphotransferase (APT) family kinase protein
MAEWDRELHVDPEAVRHAAGAPENWRLLGTGWDCDAWVADESVVWRVPRRDVGILALCREAAVMPIVAPHLPAPVPVPRLVRAHGLPILARHDLVPGRELAEVGVVGPGLPAALGRFLRALHEPAVFREAGPLLPVDPIARSDSTKRVPFTHKRLDQVASQVDVAPLRPIVDEAAGPPLPMDVVCHGDLHIRHVVVDDAGELGGVIDWGDSCVGARAVDLAIVTAFDDAGQRAFFGAYGPVDAATWRHARLIGVLLGAALFAADPVGNVGAASRRWLENIARGTREPWARGA